MDSTTIIAIACYSFIVTGSYWDLSALAKLISSTSHSGHLHISLVEYPIGCRLQIVLVATGGTGGPAGSTPPFERITLMRHSLFFSAFEDADQAEAYVKLEVGDDITDIYQTNDNDSRSIEVRFFTEKKLRERT